MTYIVKSGDTLWLIAKEQLGDATKWQAIYHRNINKIKKAQSIRGRDHLRGPDWIYPGLVLEI